MCDEDNRNAKRTLVPIAPRINLLFHVETRNAQHRVASKKRALQVNHLEYDENVHRMAGMKMHMGAIDDQCSTNGKRKKVEQAKRLVATIARSVGQAVEDAIEEQVTHLANAISESVEQAIPHALLPFIEAMFSTKRMIHINSKRSKIKFEILFT